MVIPVVLGFMGAMATQSFGTVLGVVIGQSISPLLAPIGDTFGQAAYRVLPSRLIPIAEAVELRYRGKLTPEQYEHELKSQGFNDDRREWFYDVSESLLSIVELISLYRRGILSETDLMTRSGVLKWSGDSVKQLLEVSQVIPSAQDIIAFAVREVYSPEIAEAFGQFEGLDEVFDKAKKDITAIGMLKEVFAQYWAAHWQLPSLLQGYEMLHRGVIPAIATPERPLSLGRLMTALDIMPAWREKLTAISYSPYTRVDVRRMHKIGVLNDEDVFTAYADVGFSPFVEGHVYETVAEAFQDDVSRHDSKAGRMLDFTIIYNSDPLDSEKSEADKQRDLTRTDIMKGFRDGLLEEKETLEALAKMGYDSDEVDYYMSRVDYELSQNELDDTLKYLHDAYLKGVITFENVTDELGKLGLPAKMTDYYLKVWALERMARTNKPTKSELATFLRKEIIDGDTWYNEMLGLGYPDRYIKWYREAG